jgi:hypothetical protein
MRTRSLPWSAVSRHWKSVCNARPAPPVPNAALLNLEQKKFHPPKDP